MSRILEIADAFNRGEMTEEEMVAAVEEAVGHTIDGAPELVDAVGVALGVDLLDLDDHGVEAGVGGSSWRRQRCAAVLNAWPEQHTAATKKNAS